MKLNDDLKLRMATRLIDKNDVTWWDNLKLQTPTPITWGMFIQEFNEQFYTQFHGDQKRWEFFRLKQFGKTITELRELTKFASEMANSNEYLCSKFEEDLALEIREQMFISSNQN